MNHTCKLYQITSLVPRKTVGGIYNAAIAIASLQTIDVWNYNTITSPILTYYNSTGQLLLSEVYMSSWGSCKVLFRSNTLCRNWWSTLSSPAYSGSLVFLAAETKNPDMHNLGLLGFITDVSTGDRTLEFTVKRIPIQ